MHGKSTFTMHDDKFLPRMKQYLYQLDYATAIQQGVLGTPKLSTVGANANGKE
jgi:hypothetical protein